MKKTPKKQQEKKYLLAIVLAVVFVITATASFSDSENFFGKARFKPANTQPTTSATPTPVNEPELTTDLPDYKPDPTDTERYMDNLLNESKLPESTDSIDLEKREFEGLRARLITAVIESYCAETEFPEECEALLKGFKGQPRLYFREQINELTPDVARQILQTLADADLITGDNVGIIADKVKTFRELLDQIDINITINISDRLEKIAAGIQSRLETGKISTLIKATEVYAKYQEKYIRTQIKTALTSQEWGANIGTVTQFLIDNTDIELKVGNVQETVRQAIEDGLVRGLLQTAKNEEIFASLMAELLNLARENIDVQNGLNAFAQKMAIRHLEELAKEAKYTKEYALNRIPTYHTVNLDAYIAAVEAAANLNFTEDTQSAADQVQKTKDNEAPFVGAQSAVELGEYLRILDDYEVLTDDLFGMIKITPNEKAQALTKSTYDTIQVAKKDIGAAIKQAENLKMGDDSASLEATMRNINAKMREVELKLNKATVEVKLATR